MTEQPSNLLLTFAEFAIEYYPLQLDPHTHGAKETAEWVTGDPTPDTAFPWNGSKSKEENIKDMNSQVEKDRE